MSIYSKFLNSTPIVAAIVAMGVITIPIADADAQQRNKGKTRISKPNSAHQATTPRGNRSINRARSGRSAVSNRPVSRSVTRPTRSSRANASPTRRNNTVSTLPRGGNSAIQNRTTTRVVNNNRGNRSVTRNRTNTTVINTNRGNRTVTRNRTNTNVVRNTNRGNRSVVRNTGRGSNRDVIQSRNNTTVINNNRTIVRNRGSNTTIINNNSRRNGGVINTVVNNNNGRPIRVVGNNRGYRNGYHRGYRNGYRYRDHSGAFVTGLAGGALLYSAFNTHYYYNNYYSSVSFNYGYGYPYYYGPSFYRSRFYGPSYYGWSYYYSPRYRYRPSTRVVYVERPVETIYREVPTSYQYADNQSAYQNSSAYQYQPQQIIDENCLQIREYTTTIEIGGETVDAYGQACLMPDGSWKFGDPIAEPEF